MTESEQIVYISCVKQVRYSFVSHLSEALRRKGIIDVFIDTDDFLSNESQSKVERARVSVVVLSGNSTVCLDKLVNVLGCQRNIDQVVVPVLYGEIPLQVEWDKALNSRGLSSVHQSRNKCTDSELVEEITRDVYEKLFYMEGIGIYSKRLEIENIVCKQPFGVRCVGIWGMPGIGKTTLAKAVFDQMSGEFDASCFIEDFDKVIHEKGVYRLLEEHFLKEKPGTDSTITKLSLLSNKLNNKRVLVVLDDLRNPLIAEPLLGGFHWFGPESLIIITSRDKQVLRLCRVNQIYEVQGLNKKEALQLFLRSASIKNKGEQNLKELSMKVIEYANGNPLALSIYGRELKGKKHLSEMETTFLKLKGHPPFKIVDAFKSSYESLNDREKNIFLDIACFFEGENVDYVMQLLEGCGFLPHVGIDVLVEKCLVTISENRVWMHNLIQDVGREIINKETVQIERRSRLWKPGNIKYLLEDNRGKEENGDPKTTSKRAKGLEQIEGIFLDTSNISFDAEPSAFENMLNLRLLKIYCSNPEIYPVINFPNGSLRYLPNELRLLHWENYPLQSLPQNFDPKHLVEINMPNSQLQKLWGKTKNLEMLKTVRLCHSQQLVDISDLWEAPHLEVIDLQGCTRLQSFPNTGQFLHLRVLNLSHCIEIKKIPEVPPNIKKLHLQGTGIIALPLSTTFEPNHTKLLNFLTENPGLSDALKLERLRSLLISSSYCQVLGKLIRLDLKDCSRLQSLPNMVNLEFLEVLELSGCSKLETIQGFPPNLKELYIARTAVRQVPQLPQSLELFNAHGCLSLELICLDSSKLLMHYTFSNCFNLSPQVINDFLVKVLANAQHIPRERQQELNESPAFSFCVPSHGNQYSKLDLQPGFSVMTRLNPSWRNTLVGFAMLVEVAFSEDYCDTTGFGISCVCRWKNKEGHSHRIERNLHCWALGKAVQKDHMFVFCDVNMRPSTNEGNDPNIWADLVVFEFFPINKQKKPLDDCCTVKRCGVRVITAATGSTSLENILPVLSSNPMKFSGNEEVWRVNYDGLQEIDKALFLYIAGLFNDEDVGLVAPLIANIIDMDVSYGLKVLADRSLISVSSNGEIVMHYLLRQMGKEILHCSSYKVMRLVKSSKSSTTNARNLEPTK
ncbi:predicted protein [Arabidopsis lyrata subsp. lyrata]|uniref:Predicted protein n=1 Tax=Arabidopsis lyrata subsp. lyrata TaxID=81972 RepID=D7MKY3_ARALL|nr:probable WRKY transcription factor 16 [Arabidopsis lyrata subsp. lyrata]EFH41558.1 predicted protein [Arabidopsis lyrata subsp. lyrata]|eukprot:XP_002865299.1 probable WRKY transcription factor 16 [Arabidopsis lyrata subsp. lyrata]